jgi:hypothetical protein
MSTEDQDPADTQPNDAAAAANQADTFKRERDAATKAVLDNMAKLRALRLAREATLPPAPAKKTRAKSSAKNKSPAKNTTAEKPPALADWLAGQQNGGHRT